MSRATLWPSVATEAGLLGNNLGNGAAIAHPEALAHEEGEAIEVVSSELPFVASWSLVIELLHAVWKYAEDSGRRIN
ncbi:MAG: hypothetical protein Q8O67_03455 [Deltaproteobacteria bacterium]|nr:hypothetical protein [Deltaproteobacteria bacterium]